MNETEREKSLLELLGVALDTQVGERRAQLEALTTDLGLVEEVLAMAADEDDLGDFLAVSAAEELVTELIASGEVDTAPPSIPGFVIERALGEGGMGRVYLARQTEPVERLVAIKLVHASLGDPEVARRFAAEQQMLARLGHPAIAQLYTAGTTLDGRPYVVMEHVDGLPITTHCDRERLSIEQRLALFVEVCRGVEHAHRKQVLHCDLKPSNILVTTADGRAVPKIIDFGIARSLGVSQSGGAMLTTALVVGTPHYMSPEALEPCEGPRDLDTRADVYSLGVVLYELLTGSRPFATTAGDWTTLVRRIAEEEPPRPSTRIGSLDDDTRRSVAAARARDVRQLARRLGGDLDWIALKALARQREERYGSAAELAADLERSLRHQPVSARPPSVADRLRKLVRRHRLAAALSVVTFVAVLAAAVLSSLALVRATRAERAARGEAAASSQVLAFLVDLFDAALPERSRGKDPSARELVARGVEKIHASELAPLQRARLLHTLAEVQLRLGEYDSGRDLAAEALRVREEQLGERHPDVLATLELLGNLEMRAGRFAQAEPRFERLVEIAGEGDDKLAQADAFNNLANLRLGQVRLAEAESLQRRTLALRREALAKGADAGQAVAGSLNNLGVLLWRQGRYAEAEPYLREALSLFESGLGADHPRVATTLANLGLVLRGQDRLDEGRALEQRALAIREKVLGPDHPDTAASLNNLAIDLARTGDLVEAEATHRRSLEIRRRVLGDDHPDTLQSLGNLGGVLRREKRLAEAEAVQRELLEARIRISGDDDPLTARARSGLAATLRDAGRFAEAEALLRQALHDQRAKLGNQHLDVATTLYTLGVLEERTGHTEEAAKLLRESLAIRETLPADEKALEETRAALARVEPAG